MRKYKIKLDVNSARVNVDNLVVESSVTSSSS